MNETPNYYAIIPANVRYANLKPNAKLLYGEITALSNKHGFCFASNKYFAELYKVNKNTISSWISDLKNYGFVTVKIERNVDNQITKRCIGILKKMDNPIHEKLKYNNTSINTTSNNIYIKEKFLNDVMLFDYPEEMKLDFINYWTEKSSDRLNAKMRYQKQATFDVKLRLDRWAKNSAKWNTKKAGTSKLDAQIDEWQKAKSLL
tara:strand:+ start:2456 stop:3070 length:615 start_codon:yes stop_codon:yes gene_type:complete